jgi:predicted metal-dependent enzyme (double-stranded beta helix superfamily)
MQYPESIQKLIDLIKSNDNITPKRIKELIEEANIQPEDLAPWADFNHPKEDGYGRKMIYDAGYFEIMTMSWNPGDFSGIHDHGYTEWGAVQVFGTAQHHSFKYKGNTLTTTRKEVLLPGEIVKVNNPFIHQMGNNTTTPYMTLHIYGSNSRDELVTQDSKIYEVEKGRVIVTSGGAFFDLPVGSYVVESDDLETDASTMLDQSFYLMKLFERMDQNEETFGKKAHVLEVLQNHSIPVL